MASLCELFVEEKCQQTIIYLCHSDFNAVHVMHRAHFHIVGGDGEELVLQYHSQNGVLFKGALDKHNIYLFTSNFIGNSKFKKYRNFQLILSMGFHFMRYFCE